MALFVISWTDKPGALPTRMAAREDHLAYVRGFGYKIRLGGPFLDANGDMAGSLIMLEAETLAEAEAFHAADPYKLAGLFETSSVRAWRLTTGAGVPAKA